MEFFECFVYQFIVDYDEYGNNFFFKQMMMDVFVIEKCVQKVFGGYKFGIVYLGNFFGQFFKSVVVFIVVGFFICVYFVFFGGFDMYVNQVNFYQNFMKIFLDGFVVFQKDFEVYQFDDQVIIMIFFEFGCCLMENESKGIDYGIVVLFFVMGLKIKGGFYGMFFEFNFVCN